MWFTSRKWIRVCRKTLREAGQWARIAFSRNSGGMLLVRADGDARARPFRRFIVVRWLTTTASATIYDDDVAVAALSCRTVPFARATFILMANRQKVYCAPYVTYLLYTLAEHIIFVVPQNSRFQKLKLAALRRVSQFFRRMSCATLTVKENSMACACEIYLFCIIECSI